MFWPDEMHVSVVARSRLLDGNIIGDSCSVRVRRQVHVHPCNRKMIAYCYLNPFPGEFFLRFHNTVFKNSYQRA